MHLKLTRFRANKQMTEGKQAAVGSRQSEL